jgi:hypothetical protein
VGPCLAHEPTEERIDNKKKANGRESLAKPLLFCVIKRIDYGLFCPKTGGAVLRASPCWYSIEDHELRKIEVYVYERVEGF